MCIQREDIYSSLQVVEDHYVQGKQALPGPDLLVDFEKDQIKLDIPEEGITLDEGWTITPLIPPVVRCIIMHLLDRDVF